MDSNTNLNIYPKLSDSQLKISNKLKAIVRSRQGPEKQVKRIVDDILRLCAEADSSQHLSVTLRNLWVVVIKFARQFYPDRQNQTTLVTSIKILRERVGEVKDGFGVLWKDLPFLADCLFENWHDPLLTSKRLTERDILEWKNLNSFFARLTSREFCPWLQLPILELRNALESPPSGGDVMECRIWVATEWLIRCGDVLLQRLTGERVEGRLALSLVLGPICRNVQLLDIERWKFWKGRLAEISKSYQRLSLSPAIWFRMGDALQRMSAVEKEKALLEYEGGIYSVIDVSNEPRFT